ncbi:hypothetical protein E2562_037623 [Oryza meyeriana var. granulata]|uniref:Uncharacterized protein n=1 Tax=Oryza meyeriana var. granulata TaxID=110450 RepID=A0A6G1CBK3_9ORYZ|nr:hypothetical protein E2562_037623 [Oryza meyeriana var. granulata]
MPNLSTRDVVAPPPASFLDFSPFEPETGASLVRPPWADGCDLSALGAGCHPSHGLQGSRGSVHERDQRGAYHGGLPPVSLNAKRFIGSGEARCQFQHCLSREPGTV